MFPPPRPRRTADSRGVSTVIGVIMMVAIAVVLAAVIAGMALGFEDRLREPAPIGGFDHDYEPTGEGNTNHRPYVTITHELGETVNAEDIVIRDEAGNQIRWNDVWTGGERVEAGEFVHIDGFASDDVLDPICEAGDTYYVIYQRDGGTDIVTEWSAPQESNPPVGSPVDDNDNGVVDECEP